MADYYDAIAQGYDELHGEEQQKKLALIKHELHITPATRLLDVGCGTGESSQFDCDVIGVDPSAGLLEKATAKYPSKVFVQAHAEELPFKDASFDVVVSLTAIQNFSNIVQGLKEMKRVGSKQFVLTYLKRSPKAAEIEAAIKKVFLQFTLRKIEEDKDIIFIITEQKK